VNAIAAVERQWPLEVCPFCMPTEHYLGTAEREVVTIGAHPTRGPLGPKEGPWVVAAKHRPGCPRGRWCPGCRGDFWAAGPAEGVLGWMGYCRACELREEAEDERSEARLARAEKQRREQERARAEHDQEPAEPAKGKV